MKKLLILCLAFSLAFSAEPNPFADSGDSGGDESIFDDSDTAKPTNKMMFLDAVQKKFWSPSRKPSDNTLNIKFVAGETHKIRTRANMTTTIVLDGDKIASVIIGDSVGFEMKELGTSKYDLSNIITIKPKLIGIDTNLTIIGESGNIYSFYVFSTDHKNRRNPAFLVFVSEIRKIDKIKVENLEEKAKKEQEKAFKKLIGNDSTDENEIETTSPNDSIEKETDKEIIIGDKVNQIKINKDEIRKVYLQFPKTDKGVVSRNALKLQAKEIFHDKKWTYFKFDRELATSKFPAIFRVIDGYDNPMNSRIVGNYLIVETIADKWTMRIGNEWVCVRSKEDIINSIQEQKEKNAIKAPKFGKPNRKKSLLKSNKLAPLTKALEDYNKQYQKEELIQKENNKNNKNESNKNTQNIVKNPQNVENIEQNNTDSTDSTESANDTELVESVDSVESIDSTNDTESAESAESTDSTNDTKSQESAESTNDTESVESTESVENADSKTQIPQETNEVEVTEILSDKENNEIQEKDYQGEFNEKEKEMTKEQKEEIESQYKSQDLELPQGMPIEEVEIKKDDI